MYLLGTFILLLEYMVFSHSFNWNFQHPKVLYSWEGGCIWIPCTYRIPGNGHTLENLIVYHNYIYNASIKDFMGTILYSTLKSPDQGQTGKFGVQQERIQFLGDNRSNCTLRIHPVSVNDSGILGLRMIAENNKWMENVTLNISEMAPPPSIQLPTKIQEFQMAKLTCSLNTACFGYQIELRWSLEGPTDNKIELTDKKILTQSQLSFQPQWEHHGKNATCQLWDLEKNQSLSKTSVTLDVKHKPKLHIKVSPQETMVKEGMHVTMTCQIISSNPEYQTVSWLKDGKPLPKQQMLRGQKELTLFPVTKDMRGQYQCEARNALGTGKSESVTFQVHYPPEPSQVDISPLPVVEGRPVQLTCISSASPPPTNFSWFHNEQTLPVTTQKFQINQVGLNHAGTYSCLAENSLGRGEVDQEADLDVHYPPKQVMTVIQTPTRIREGDNVTVSCQYNSSNPKVTYYKWDFERRQRSLNSRELKIYNVAWDHKTVACAACNEWCSWSPTVNLHVQYAPRDVTVQFSSTRPVLFGAKLVLRCSFSSSSPATVSFLWKKNGILQWQEQELHFDAITPEDSGTYHCEVNNSIGRTQSPAQMVSVLYAPRRLRVTFSPKSSMVEGKMVVLRCEGEANPSIYHYAWFDWNNQDLHHYEQTLRLEPVTVQHSGAYWCQGINKLGQSRSPLTTLTVHYSSKTITKHVALGLAVLLITSFLLFWVIKLQQRKRIQSQQGLQENSSGQSFFVRNTKVRGTPLAEGPPSLGCYNPVMEEATSYAVLNFPDTPRTGNSGTSGTQRPSPNWTDTVTYSVVQKPKCFSQGDYENLSPDALEDEGLHYSELVRFGAGERSPEPEAVEYVTLKH
ncbi:B-cell receptor CD22 [Suncus etruscus]|uniref:B-cell receptor CD22 n=1 Tax=Suncus etruscus TaxID=109475 RepID=UPI00210F5C74|nr:B-cell receptor CD22 [Suncus etruscus]